ncbi:MAG: hypothetical protein O3A63_03850 [Proteobacteria bacterium]|nr:hypothetical protein [Pseudomonadota bacterium]
MGAGKYTIAREVIDKAIVDGREHGWEPEDMLVALIVSSVEQLKATSGVQIAHQALKYELDNLGGNVDTQFLRSR